jgi:1-acyl-sn-glycerol-3-phosphate acyltransferase
MLKSIFFLFFVKPFVFIVSGITITGKYNIPEDGQFVIIANHNSHMDIMAIMSIFDSRMIKNIKPVGAKDYFYKNKIIGWISKNIIDIIPLERMSKNNFHANPMQNIYDALDGGYSVIIFPEGSRGNPEEMQGFKNGIGHLASKYPDIPIVPIFLENSGRSLPRNEALFVPFIINVDIKEATTFNDKNTDIKSFVKILENKFIKE